MTDLVQTLRSAMLHGTKGVLRTQSGFRGVVLADGYPFDRWANDGYVDRDARFFLLQLATKAPYWQGHAALEDRVRGVECRFSGCAAQGLGDRPPARHTGGEPRIRPNLGCLAALAAMRGTQGGRRDRVFNRASAPRVFP